MVSFDDFKKVDLRVARVLAAERVEGSEKLLKLTLDAGDKDAADLPAVRQIIAGVGKQYEPEALVGCEIVIVANLEPRKLMGLESNGMLLAAHGLPAQAGKGGAPVLLMPDREVPPGSGVS